MVRSITSFGAGAIIVATSMLPTLVQANVHKPVHRITRHAHIRRAAAIPAGWEAQGCITDAEAPNRVLSDHHTDGSLTTASCIKSCAANGYKLAGTQFGKECWCGNALSTGANAGQSSGGCDMPCAGDAGQVCGGNYHLNLFAATSSKNASTTTTASYSTPTADSKKYTIEDRFSGKDFFSDKNWWFFNFPDPTNGQVNYLNKADATAAGLAYVQPDGVAVMKVDNSTKLEKGQARKSVRIQSSKQYDGGLFVADFLHMPYGCSVWPAYWTVGDNWPNNGEIDILENVNLATANQYTLHTGPNSTCTLDTNPIAKYKSTSNMMGKVCASKEGDNAGCGFSDPEPASYGEAFNKAGGAVIAMEWTKTGIRIWRFKRDSIPADLQGDAANPNPETWGAPVASWTDAACDIANEVKKHNIVINTTLCGGWAGDAYGSSGCPGTCTDQVMEPSNYNNAYWEIKSITVYH
ncbi:putative glycosidase C21B10,07 OS=Schizosaccharomyces pombe (strain 972 / ATCC 24843) GN=SPBC21B10.07 PE=3 SV=1 [Rhizoctonia solani AG-1 IB]|uniref:Putative glycosidase C21B10,07 n=1 Tax=Thanatephorus cucumeris (strain AG1-IB / isolate 7/3/14) TaxID=1108050 RepID=A0A0B7FNS2_THACB|nr:putative glycosidase C21B10,07 OS=Schizosaccharomyces pombe (strain 972 / ATCC 24843) GN=SPBC21B10.07 PE=3 SV=1 [Rhizoctonia solani AG-1 IB]